MKPVSGLLVWVELGTRQPPGHEQAGRRPCVVVAVPTSVHRLRFPMIIVAPMTTATLAPATLYPRLTKGAGNLPGDGTVLLDQLLAVDVRRVKKRIGQLTAVEYQPIADGLRQLFKL